MRCFLSYLTLTACQMHRYPYFWYDFDLFRHVYDRNIGKSWKSSANMAENFIIVSASFWLTLISVTKLKVIMSHRFFAPRTTCTVTSGTYSTPRSADVMLSASTNQAGSILAAFQPVSTLQSSPMRIPLPALPFGLGKQLLNDSNLLL